MENEVGFFDCLLFKILCSIVVPKRRDSTSYIQYRKLKHTPNPFNSSFYYFFWNR